MEVSKSELISAFADKKFPTGSDFRNLIDSCYNDGTYYEDLSAGNITGLSANVENSTIQNLTATNLQIGSIYVDGAAGINASVIVSTMPSGSAILYFEKGILIEMQVL